jgi:guanylate kinase
VKSDNYALSVSATTRDPRQGEVEGESYFFKTKEQFEEMIKADALVEYACYVGNYYGTPKAFVEEKMAEGKDVLLEIEIQGALKIKEKYPDAVLIFITTKDAKTLKERLTGRGTETEEVINQRLARAAEEAEGVEAYDYIVINDILEDCVKTVDRIIKSEHNRTSEKISIIQDIRMNLVSKGEIK